MMYKKVPGGVIRLRDNAFIPEDPRNVDYQEYIEWCERGNIPEEDLKEKKERRKAELREQVHRKVRSWGGDVLVLVVKALAGDMQAVEECKRLRTYIEKTAEIERAIDLAPDPDTVDPLTEERKVYESLRGIRGRR